ncbi:MAG: hypothetical protein Kow0069_20030 [Promethearchaeota archaeon]
MTHKYWARRAGSPFRAALLYLFHEGAAEVGDDDGAFWDLFGSDVDFGGRHVVMDPFAGGGTVPFEAARLGCRVLARDLNPLAWFVTRTTLAVLPVADVEAAFRDVEAEVVGRIRPHYQTTCACSPAVPRDVLHYHWVLVVTCGHCGGEVPLFNDHVVARERRERGGRRRSRAAGSGAGDPPPDAWARVVCPACLEVFATPNTTEPCSCPACGVQFDPRARGPKRGGRFTCPRCGGEGAVRDRTGRGGRKPESLMYAVEYHCPGCGRWVVRRPSDYDLATYERAAGDLKTLEAAGKLVLPDQARRSSFSDRVLNHGYVQFREMFNDRQLLCLGLLMDAIVRVVRDMAAQDALLMAFSDALAFNNEFCEYNRANRNLCWIWNRRTLTLRTCHVENNVWGTDRGTGTFRKVVGKLLRAKAHLAAPVEKLVPREKRLEAREAVRPFKLRLVDHPADVVAAPTAPAACISCGDSTALGDVPDRSVDAVVTDPPYLDLVMYADMADFHHAWLHHALKDRHECFAAPLSPKSGEIVKDPAAGKSTGAFASRLTAAFAQAASKLKPGGAFVFTYHHLDLDAWKALGGALLGARLVVTASYPLVAEMKTSMHQRDKRRRAAHDVLFACRLREDVPQSGSTPGSGRFLRLVERATERVLRQLGGGIVEDSLRESVSLAKALEVATSTRAPAPVPWDDLLARLK